MDSVWNFGIFDFREPNFVYRFVKGETDYMVAGYPFEWFMPEYVARGSRVVEQELNLTQAEAMDMLSRLRTLTLPENRRYRYNYVKTIVPPALSVCSIRWRLPGLYIPTASGMLRFAKR